MNFYKYANKKYILIFFLVIIFGLNYSTQIIEAKFDYKEVKRILLISSYSPCFETFFQQIEGIKSQIEGKNIELDIEFMDSKRFFTDENLNNFYISLKYKLENLDPYDAIIVSDDNALNFVQEYNKKLFEGIPIVFLGINNIENAVNASRDKHITGIIEDVSISDTIKIAYKVNDKAKNVIALTDNTNSGQGDLKSFYLSKNNIEELNFEDIDLSELSFDEFSLKLQQLNEDDIVLLLSVYKDKNNKTKSFNEGIKLVLDNCSQPVYHPYYHGIGNGLIGGKVISHYEQGSKAAKVVNEIFSGTNIADIPCIMGSPNHYLFDYNVLKSYNINENILPKDSTLLNKEESFLKKYLIYIIGAVLLILMQFIVIIVLKTNIKRRKIAEKHLLKNSEKIEYSNKKLNEANIKLSIAYEKEKNQNVKINDLINRDMVTGLHSRYCIFRIIDNIINYEKSNIISVLLLDIDNFKNINDTYGHDKGDEVIKAIGKKLNKYQDDNISIGRLGGDEFLIMSKNQLSKNDIINLVNSIQKVFEDPVSVDNTKFYISVSIGIAVYSNNGDDRRDIIRKADLALYNAKKSGKNKYVFYNEDINNLIKNKMLFQREIKKAINNKEFYLKYQPYININTNKIIGFETLIRWDSEKYGNVSPYKLIRNAEEMGVITEIGEWVLKQASLFAKKINENKKYKLKISVNISAIQLMESDFYNRTMRIIKEAGNQIELMCLEMTETVLIESIETGATVIQELINQGFDIALDDFGTGYSSLKYFKELPTNIIKIDKSFVDNIETNTYNQKLVKVMIQIAHNKGVEVIAEGIETEGQLNILKSYGCDIVQGYLISKPLRADDVVDFLEEHFST